MLAKLMELSNTLMRYRGTAVAGSPEWDEAVRLLLLMLAPAAPHITEELWSRRLAAAGLDWTSIHGERWPDVDTSVVAEATREVPIQVNGKLRDRLVVPAGIDGGELERLALASPKIAAILAGRTPDRIIAAGGGKLLNIVIRDA
jgi:leucyl-tRNA synthetase